MYVLAPTSTMGPSRTHICLCTMCFSTLGVECRLCCGQLFPFECKQLIQVNSSHAPNFQCRYFVMAHFLRRFAEGFKIKSVVQGGTDLEICIV